MKLEPVYLVAPRRQIPMRRAFLIAAGTGLAGIGLGLVGGWFARQWTLEPPDAGNGDAAADPRLAYAMQLAEPGVPIDDLLAGSAMVLTMVHETEAAGHPQVRLWAAVRRVADAIVSDAEMKSRPVRARAVLDLVRRHPGHEGDFHSLLPALTAAAAR